MDLNKQSEIRNEINNLVAVWNFKKFQIREFIRINGGYTKDDISYYMPGANWIIDHSLIYDQMPFEFKPPIILRALWSSSYQSIINLVNDMINFEKQTYKQARQVSDIELKHVLYLKNIAFYVLLNKYNVPSFEAKKVLAGDYKRKEVF